MKEVRFGLFLPQVSEPAGIRKLAKLGEEKPEPNFFHLCLSGGGSADCQRCRIRASASGMSSP